MAQPDEDAQAEEATDPGKLYELRLYTANPGKLSDLHARFRDHTTRLFEKHGIENLYYWTVSEGAGDEDAENMLVYIIAHDNQEAAEASWEAFRNDPEWVAAKEASEVDGPLLVDTPVSYFMTATDFSPPDPQANADSDAPAKLYELRKYNDGQARVPGTVGRFRDWEAELFRNSGIETVAFWTTADNEAFVYLLAHEDRESSRENWATFFEGFRSRGGLRGGGRRGGGRRGGGARDGDAQADDDGAQADDAGARQGGGGRRRGGFARRGGRRGGRGGGGTPGSEVRFLVPTDYSPRK